MTEYHSDRKPLLYRVIRVTMKMAMAVFFQKIEIRHGENVPKRGPVVFLANHPNSIMDALLLGVVTNRKVNYLAHAGLFSGKFKSWFLHNSGVIPVYRRQDAPDKMAENVKAFEACYQALERGEAIGIFPEGTSDMSRKVKKVKTGAARIILESEKLNSYHLGVRALPVGLYFFSRSRFRSKVLINIGKPIDLKPFLQLNEEDSYDAVHALTNKIQESIEKLTVNVRHEELDSFVRDIEALYREELKQSSDVAKGNSSVTDFIVTQKIAECVEYYYQHNPKRVSELRDSIRVYKRKLQRLQLNDQLLKDNPNFGQILRTGATAFAAAMAGLPVAIYGIVNNFVPYYIAEYFAKKFMNDRTKILSALLIGGGSAFIVFYTVQTTLVWYLLGSMWSTLYLVSLPMTGFFALTYVKKIRFEQQKLSLSLFMFTNRQLLNKMRRERRELLSEIDKVKEEYLGIVGL